MTFFDYYFASFNSVFTHQAPRRLYSDGNLPPKYAQSQHRPTPSNSRMDSPTHIFGIQPMFSPSACEGA